MAHRRNTIEGVREAEGWCNGWRRCWLRCLVGVVLTFSQPAPEDGTVICGRSRRQGLCTMRALCRSTTGLGVELGQPLQQ